MKNIERIDAYLNGEMSPEEVRAFEVEMENDAALKEAVELEQTLMDGIFAANLRAELEEIAKEERSANTGGKVVRLGQWRQIAVAASVLLLVGFFFWWNIQGGEQSPAFANIYSPDPGLPVVMGEMDEGIFNEAMVSYKEGEIQKAKTAFEVLCAGAEVDKYCFYLAQTLIQEEKYASAVIHLEKVVADTNSDFRQKAQWHLAYCLYQIGDDKYTAILQDISDDANHPFHKEASELLSE
jgi:hypothetical protein